MIGVEQYLLLVVLWVCWCGLHSGLISVSVSTWLERVLGKHVRFYRIGYNLISAATLIVPVSVSLSFQPSETIVMAWPQHITILRLLFVGAALFLFWAGGRHYDMKYFLGLSQLRTGRNSPLLNNQQSGFSLSGVSSIIRHPWYLGGMILVWSAPAKFYPSTVITAVVISGYFLVGLFLEERKLVRCFGDTYRAYQQEVSMLIPVKWLNKKFLKHT